MGKWIHRLSDVDRELLTATCEQCGPTEIRIKTNKAKCVVAIREQRGVRPPRRNSHGLTPDEAKGRCAELGECQICGIADNLCLDHCHQTKTVRGILCRRCNLALGFMGDDVDRLAKAIDYLSARAS